LELGSVTSPTDVTADGGGITLKGATDKTINWVSATDAWTSSENFNLATGKVYEINGTTVLSATALGSGITSLPSVTSVNGTTIPSTATLLTAASTSSALTKLGTGAGIIKSDASGNLTAATSGTDYLVGSNTTYIGTTSVALNRASAALALTGVSIDGNAGTVTNGIYTTTTSLPNVTSVNSTSIPFSSTLVTTTSGKATLATSIDGGAAGNVPYQSATGTTAFVTNGTAGQVLTSNGSSAPSWQAVTPTVHPMFIIGGV
jgi:hypothetical protein